MTKIRLLPTLLLTGALLMSGAGAQVAAGDLTAAATVTVQVGDTAYSLARRAGLSLAQLLSVNNLPTADLKVGQVLTLRAPVTTHDVLAGETLYSIARLHAVSLESLLAANDLAVGAVLRIGQTLKLPVGAVLTAAPAPVPPTSPAATPFRPGAPTPVTPVVQPGPPMPRSQGPAGPALLGSTLDTGTPGTGILPTAVPNAAALSPAPLDPSPMAAAPTDWRSAAMALVNTPYVYGGATRTGTDCSGFVLQVFTPLGISLPRTSADQSRSGQDVGAGALQPGDLVFFDTERTGRVSHVGIYLGEDQFVSANSYQGRVTVDHLMSDRYWGPRFVTARRVLPVLTAQRH